MQELSNLLAQHGLVLVFANVLLTQLGIPLPAQPMLIVAGAFVAQQQIELLPLIAVAVLASLMGDTPWYFAGRRYGYGVLRTLCRIAVEPDSCVRQTESIFTRWGPQSLMVAKYIPGFATVAPPLAGTMRLAFPRFLAYSAVAGLLWAVLPVLLGMAFHGEVEQVLVWLEGMGPGALLVIVLAFALYVAVKAVERYLLLRFLRMIRISVAELAAMVQRGERPVILDVRSATARSLDPRHIPGALPLDMDARGAVRIEVPPEREVVVYCS